MTTYTYANTRNGGQEKIVVKDGKFFIASDWGKGFCDLQQVTLDQVKMGMAYTNAPAHVVAAITQ